MTHITTTPASLAAAAVQQASRTSLAEINLDALAAAAVAPCAPFEDDLADPNALIEAAIDGTATRAQIIELASWARFLMAEADAYWHELTDAGMNPPAVTMRAVAA